MPSSGTFAWDPTVAEIIDEAAERARVDPGTLTVARQFSIRRSLNTILQRWATQRPRQRLINNRTLTLTAGDPNYSLPADVQDILYAVLRRDAVDIPMHPMTRDDYSAIPDKTMQGRPDRYWIEKHTPVVMTLWQVPENSTDIIQYSALRRAEDIKADMSQTPDLPYLWLEAAIDGLAVSVYQKFGTSDRTDREGQSYKAFDINWLKDLRAAATGSYQAALQEDRERVDTHVHVRYGSR